MRRAMIGTFFRTWSTGNLLSHYRDCLHLASTAISRYFWNRETPGASPTIDLLDDQLQYKLSAAVNLDKVGFRAQTIRGPEYSLCQVHIRKSYLYV